MRIYQAIFAATVLLGASCCAQSEGKFDGALWNSLPDAARTAWVSGFLSGVSAATDDTVGELGIWIMSGDIPCKDTQCIEKIRSNVAGVDHVYRNITAAQLVAGITVLYSDYRNTNIPIIDLQKIAVEAMTGSSDEQVQKRLSYFRRQAAN